MWLKFLVTGTLALAAVPAVALPGRVPTPPAQPVHENPKPCQQGCLNPVEAVTYASYLGERAGVAGEFAMPVKAIGFENDRLFLNSELDYRDRNCLTVVMPLSVAKIMAGGDDQETLRKYFGDRRVIVRGVAKQVRVNFLTDGKPSDKYYYQVHLPITSTRQLIRLPG